MSFEVIASEEGDGPRRPRSARDSRAPLLTVDQIDSVRSKSSCDALVKRVNAGGRKNRFSYDWFDGEKGEWFGHLGTVRAAWDPSANKCRIFFDYPDEKFFVAFSGEGSLAQFSKDSERNFTWINGNQPGSRMLCDALSRRRQPWKRLLRPAALREHERKRKRKRRR